MFHPSTHNNHLSTSSCAYRPHCLPNPSQNHTIPPFPSSPFNPLHHCFPIRRPRRRHRLPRIRPQPRHIPRALHTRCIPQLHDALVVERRAEDNSDGYPIIVARPELRRARAAVYPLATQQRGNALLARLDGLDELDRWGKSDSKLDSWVSGRVCRATHFRSRVSSSPPPRRRWLPSCRTG
jgi:hypothetical protein